MPSTIETVLDQGFAERSELIRQTAIRATIAATNVQEQSQLAFLNSSALYNAMAAGRMEKNALADSIMQNRAAAGQPGNAPPGIPVK